MRKLLCALFMACLSFTLFGQSRSFADLYGRLDEGQREAVFSAEGLLLSYEGSAALRLLPPSGIDISAPVAKVNPSFTVEALKLIPYARPSQGLIDAYNALGKVGRLKGRLYHSASRDKDIPLFEEATRVRIISSSRTAPIEDPPDALRVPQSETVNLRLKDANFGNSYYRAELNCDQRGILYSLTNFRSLSYGIIPVIREEKFVAQLYVEPLREGFLIYSIAAANVSGFVASHVHIPSAIEKRLAVIIDWLVDGLNGT